jgi:hypothetical protein
MEQTPPSASESNSWWSDVSTVAPTSWARDPAKQSAKETRRSVAFSFPAFRQKSIEDRCEAEYPTRICRGWRPRLPDRHSLDRNRSRPRIDSRRARCIRALDQRVSRKRHPLRALLAGTRLSRSRRGRKSPILADAPIFEINFLLFSGHKRFARRCDERILPFDLVNKLGSRPRRGSLALAQ